MSERRVGAAVVLDPDAVGPGILTERDVLDSIGRGQDPDTELVGDHLTQDVVFASPDWSLEEAAAAMVRGSFRHLIVTRAARSSASCRSATSCAAGPTTARSATCRSPSRRAERTRETRAGHRRSASVHLDHRAEGRL